MEKNNNFNNKKTKGSLVIEMHPAIKLLIVIILMLLTFLPIGYIGYLILIIFIVVLWMVSDIGWKKMQNNLFSFLVIFILLTVVNWIFFKSPGLSIVDTDKILFNVGWHFNNIDCKGHQISYCTSPSWGATTSGMIFSGNIHGIHTYNDFYKYLTTGMDEMYKNARIVQVKIDKHIYFIGFGYNASWYAFSSQTFIFSTSIGIKIFLMISCATFLISTTSFVKLTYGVEDLLTPLKFLKFPVAEVSMIIALSLRFVPSLLEESKIINKAQASRGVDGVNGNYIDKVKSLVSLIVPMFSIAFKKANGLSDSMKSRGYDPRENRTRFRKYEIKYFDILSLILAVTIFALFLYLIIGKYTLGPLALLDNLI